MAADQMVLGIEGVLSGEIVSRPAPVVIAKQIEKIEVQNEEVEVSEIFLVGLNQFRVKRQLHRPGLDILTQRDLGVLKKKTDFRYGKRKADLVITEDDFSNKKGKTVVQSVDTDSIVEYVTSADVTSYSVS
ncbi:hypothetical protein QYF36_018054 [Acer negundo]|nr:hypothetical protein QYF36_018054 [Acer negundo]